MAAIPLFSLEVLKMKHVNIFQKVLVKRLFEQEILAEVMEERVEVASHLVQQSEC